MDVYVGIIELTKFTRMFLLFKINYEMLKNHEYKDTESYLSPHIYYYYFKISHIFKAAIIFSSTFVNIAT